MRTRCSVAQHVRLVDVLLHVSYELINVVIRQNYERE